MTHIPNPPTGWRFPWPGEIRAPLPDTLVPKREPEPTPSPYTKQIETPTEQPA